MFHGVGVSRLLMRVKVRICGVLGAEGMIETAS